MTAIPSKASSVLTPPLQSSCWVFHTQHWHQILELLHYGLCHIAGVPLTTCHTWSTPCPQQESHLPRAAAASGLPKSSILHGRVWVKYPGTAGYRGQEKHICTAGGAARSPPPQSLFEATDCHCRPLEGSLHTSFPKETCFFVYPLRSSIDMMEPEDDVWWQYELPLGRWKLAH